MKKLSEKYETTRKCIMCGADFVINSSRQKCCSTVCSSENERFVANKRYLRIREDDRLRRNLYNREWKRKNKEYVKEYSKDWKLNNKEHISSYGKKWVSKNRSHVNTYNRTVYSKKYGNDLVYTFSYTLRNWITRAFRYSEVGGKLSEFIEYTYEDLRKHLESKFKEGMTWENRGNWHIDHIKPLASFAFYNLDGSINRGEVTKCMSLENLQPLWASENCKKGCKVGVEW